MKLKIDQTLETIRRPIRDGEVRMRPLARAAGVPIAVLDGVLRDGWNPKADTLRKLEAGLARIRRPLGNGANQVRAA